MSDDSSSHKSKSWLERLSSAFTGEPRDRDELIELLRDVKERGLLSSEVLAMIEGVLQVSEMQVRDIMVPRSQMVIIKEDATIEEIFPIIIDSGHSRFPVIGSTRDEVKGLLLAKDLLKNCYAHEQKDFNLHNVLRPTSFVPESKRLDSLLKDFRRTHNHLAIVVDEYGGIAGLVTIEDVLEQIVGDIEDEFDPGEDEYISRLSDTEYTINALTPIEEFNEYFSSHFSDEEFDTVGGLVLNKLGHLPKRGEKTEINDFQFRILHADNRRIRLLGITINKRKTA